MDERELREQMCEVGRLLWVRDLIGGGEGNMSVRMGFGRLLTTPKGRCKGLLKPEDLVTVSPDGRAIGPGSPSSEVRMHLRIMNLRPDCMAIVHAHPIVATAHGSSHEPLPEELTAEAVATLGPIARVPFAVPGTDELPDAIEPFVRDHRTFLLSNHGAVSIGEDLMDAYCRMETLERVCRMALVAKQLGSVVRLPQVAVDRLKKG